MKTFRALEFALKVVLAVTLILLIAFSLQACAPKPTPAPQPTAAPAQPTPTPVPPTQPPVKEKTVLRYGSEGDMLILDPQRVQNNVDLVNAELVFGRLVWYDKTMAKPIPQVAESWTISEDGLTYVFKLRQGVKFHNGREVVADDLVYTFDRAREIGEKGRGAREIADVESYQATGKYEFTVKLKQVSPVFLPAMAHWALAIIPKEEVANIDTHPIGCGPYKFVEWIPNDHAKYVKFEEFWDKERLAKWPDEFIYLPIKDEQTRLNMLKTGAIDVMNVVSARYWEEVNNTPGLKVIPPDWTASYYCIGFNMEREPTNNKKLRQALAWAFDKEAMLKNGFFGGGEVDCSLIPRGHWAYVPFNCPTYNPEKAKQLLKEAGIPEGLKLTIRPYPEQTEITIAEIAQQNLRDIGIDAEIEMLEEGAWLDQVWFKHDGQVTGLWYTREPDPDGLMQSVLRKGGGNNWMLYYNPKVEELFDKGKATLDLEQRKQIYKELQEIILDEVPLVKITSVVRASAINTKTIKYLDMTPNGDIRWNALEMNK